MKRFCVIVQDDVVRDEIVMFCRIVGSQEMISICVEVEKWRSFYVKFWWLWWCLFEFIVLYLFMILCGLMEFCCWEDIRYDLNINVFCIFMLIYLYFISFFSEFGYNGSVLGVIV